MKFSAAVDRFLDDFQAEGRINSRNTILAYRTKLDHLTETVSNRDPSKVGPDDVKQALGRWEGNSRRQAHAIYRSFFRWCMTERIRTNNPAEMVRATKGRKPQVARLTKDEVAQLLTVSNENRRDRWVAHLGCCAGLRSQEIRGLQGRHLARPGFIWVSPQIGKGRRERWVPITADLEPVVQEMLAFVTGLDEYVLPGRRSAGHPTPAHMYDTDKMLAASTLYRQVVALGEKAGIAVKVTPHAMRHCFATYVARHTGIQTAQALLGHADISTTQRYTAGPTLDELAVSLHGFSYFHGTPVPMHARKEGDTA